MSNKRFMITLGTVLCAIGLLLSLSGCQQRPNNISQLIYSDGYLHICGLDHTERLNLTDKKLESYPFRCNRMYLAKNGWIWSGGVQSVQIYKGQDWQIFELSQASNLSPIYYAEFLSESKDGLLWASSLSLISYDPQTGQSAVIVPTIAVPPATPAPVPGEWAVTSPSQGDIGPVFEAADGALWYNQQFDGIVRWDRATGQKQLWSANDGFQGQIPIPTRFIQTHDGDIWVGLTADGVYRWHNGAWQTWLFPSEEGICIASPQQSCYYRNQGDFTVTDLLEDHASNVWVAFNRGGVALWNGTAWKKIGDFEFPAGPRVLYEDSTGTIWIGSLQRGVGKYSNGALMMYPKLNIVTFAETPDHQLFGGGSDGLYLYEPQSDQWKPYPPQQ
jgi:hypothetical protein